MESTRQQKFSRLIQKELGELFIRNKLSWFGPSGMATITVVRCSPDLSLVKVYLSLFGFKDDKKEVLEKIRTHSKEIRHQLSGKIKNQVRHIPELAFYLDDSLDYVDKMETLFRSIHKDDEH